VVTGFGVVKEIGEDLGRVWTATLAREIPEVKRPDQSRRRDLSSVKRRILSLKLKF
jgi:3-oxoacyl-(acyl-carrier-protein) synthase